MKIPKAHIQYCNLSERTKYQYYLQNIDHISAHKKSYYRNHKEHYSYIHKLYSAKRNARVNKIKTILSLQPWELRKLLVEKGIIKEC